MGAKLSIADAAMAVSSLQELNTSVSCSFPKALRVRTRKHYQWLAHKGTRSVGQSIIVVSCFHSKLQTRLGITVSRKYGKAHDRNRFKRMVREAFRTSRHLLPPGLDLNVKPKGFCENLTMEDVRREIISLLKPLYSLSPEKVELVLL